MSNLIFFVILLSCFQHCSLKRGGGSRTGGGGSSSSGGSSSGGWPSSSGSSSSSSWSSWSYGSSSWHPWTSWSSGYDTHQNHGYGSPGSMPIVAVILIVIVIIIVLIYMCTQIANRSSEETPEHRPLVHDPKVPVWPTVYPPHPEPTTASNSSNKPMTDYEKMLAEVQDEVTKRYEKILFPHQEVRPSAPPAVESSFLHT
uniref:Uncharacterized protein n=1 Tax=Romanomermis culicivorax TaxID=13658 RepID=A0A915IFL1_ROMCU